MRLRSVARLVCRAAPKKLLAGLMQPEYLMVELCKFL